MNEAFAQTRFKIEFTEDGSPTLRLPGEGESMHHSGGAARETVYIYKTIIDSALKLIPEAKIAVVGLGLAYIEISWALAVIQSGQKLALSECDSYEIDLDLQVNFLNWLKNSNLAIYDKVCFYLDKKTSAIEIKNLLNKNYADKKNMFGDLLTDFNRSKRYNVVCYDVFSNKTDLPVWNQEFLETFLKSSCHEDCVLTTYAFTGNLKRALAKNNFTLLNRPGFKGKRQSTLAVRGKFSSFDFFQTS